MFYLLSKTLQPFLWPMNIALWLLAAMCVCFFFKRDRWGKIAGAGAFAVLWIAGMPVLAFPLFGGLENRFPVLTTAEAPVVDAAVVLGGTVLGIQPPRREVQEVFGSRVMSAARLYRAGKAKRIVVSSGVPYTMPDGAGRTDAGDMADLLVEEGVPRSAIIVEDRSRNTDENARYSAELLKAHGAKRVLLVTSGFHMRRAVAMFHKYGLGDVVPFPVEIRVTPSAFSFSDLIPDGGALSMTTASIKEHVGRLFY